jgi:uncharacterized metal-binding protein
LIIESAEKKMSDSEARALHLAWSELAERTGKERGSRTRVEEVIAYAQARGVNKIGIASCIGLLWEAKPLANILEDNGFEVVSACCLAIAREDVNMKSTGIFYNPIMQASILNREGTQLNIMPGLCVGHDITFLRHSEAI